MKKDDACGTGDGSVGCASGTTIGSDTSGSECLNGKPSGSARAAASTDNSIVPGGINTSWPARDVVQRPADFADNRLREHDYDGHGWEELQRCRDIAYAWLALPDDGPNPVCPRCSKSTCGAAKDWGNYCPNDEVKQ